MELSELRLIEIPAKESASLEGMHDGEVLVRFASETIRSKIVIPLFWDFLFPRFFLIDDDGLIDKLIETDLEETAKLKGFV